MGKRSQVLHMTFFPFFSICIINVFNYKCTCTLCHSILCLFLFRTISGLFYFGCCRWNVFITRVIPLDYIYTFTKSISHGNVLNEICISVRWFSISTQYTYEIVARTESGVCDCIVSRPLSTWTFICYVCVVWHTYFEYKNIRVCVRLRFSAL